SAASRIYAPESLWPQVRERLAEEVSELKMGDVADFSNFMGAVIDEKAFAKHRQALEEARSNGRDVVAGGGSSDEEGWFIEPTVIETHDPDDWLLKEELFGPIVTTFVYPDDRWHDTLELVDRSAPYGLTGAVFARDRAAIEEPGQPRACAAPNFSGHDN